MDFRTALLILGVFSCALAGQTASKPAATAAKTQLAIQDAKIAVYDRSGKPTPSTLKINAKDSKLYTLDKSLKFQLKFSVKDEKTNQAVLVQQAFVAFVHADSNREVVVVCQPETGTKEYSVEMDVRQHEATFNGLNGTYNVRLIIGDSKAANAINWNFADVKLTFPPQVKAPVKKSQAVSYDALPEIKHTFREPEKLPPTVVSDFFTIVCLAPLVILLGAWLKIGVNFGNLQLGLNALLFHVGLCAIFGLYLMFWIELNMFTTLKYLAFIGVPTFYFGHLHLRSLHAARK